MVQATTHTLACKLEAIAKEDFLSLLIDDTCREDVKEYISIRVRIFIEPYTYVYP